MAGRLSQPAGSWLDRVECELSQIEKRMGLLPAIPPNVLKAIKATGQFADDLDGAVSAIEKALKKFDDETRGIPLALNLAGNIRSVRNAMRGLRFAVQSLHSKAGGRVQALLRSTS